MQSVRQTSHPPAGDTPSVRIPKSPPLTIERLLAGAGNYREDPMYAEREADTIRPPRFQ